MDRGAWWNTVHGLEKSRIQLSTHTHSLTHIHPPSALLSQLFSFLFTLISVAFALKIISYNRALTVIQVNFYSPELSRGVLKCSDRKLRKARIIPPQTNFLKLWPNWSLYLLFKYDLKRKKNCRQYSIVYVLPKRALVDSIIRATIMILLVILSQQTYVLCRFIISLNNSF